VRGAGRTSHQPGILRRPQQPGTPQSRSRGLSQARHAPLCSRPPCPQSSDAGARPPNREWPPQRRTAPRRPPAARGSPPLQTNSARCAPSARRRAAASRGTRALRRLMAGRDHASSAPAAPGRARRGEALPCALLQQGAQTRRRRRRRARSAGRAASARACGGAAPQPRTAAPAAQLAAQSPPPWGASRGHHGWIAGWRYSQGVWCCATVFPRRRLRGDLRCAGASACRRGSGSL